MSEVVIKVENVGKQYRLGSVGTGTISHDLNRWWAKARGKEDPYLKIGEANDRSKKGESDLVWALKYINFEVKQAEVLGIIGRNGAGKSTLLKILSRVTGPTTGDIKVKGRIASLLEVGTGFHPELTGRENIFLNGAILGMSKHEIKSKFDEIVDFSGVERYIDTPVKRYSSGMYVRLAFAVAAHLEPEILIVDEVLAVGDAEFQKKCLGKMKDVSGQGRTVLFVSHNMSAIRNLCTRVVTMSQGQIAFDGDVNEGISKYLSQNTGDLENKKIVEFSKTESPLTVNSINFLTDSNEASFDFVVDKIELLFSMTAKMFLMETFLGVIIEDEIGNTILVTSTDENETDVLSSYEPGEIKLQVGIPGKILKPGKYFVSFSLRNKRDTIYHKVDRAACFFITDFHTYRGMKNRYRSNSIVAPEITYFKK
jgi:lipopolysaccharide transport system ATP-binding protein